MEASYGDPGGHWGGPARGKYAEALVVVQKGHFGRTWDVVVSRGPARALWGSRMVSLRAAGLLEITNGPPKNAMGHLDGCCSYHAENLNG